MIAKVEMLTNAQLEHIRQIVGEAFVTNELFHNWGTEEERRNDVLKYMGTLQGVREGSIIAAVLVGSIIKVYNRVFDKVRSGK